MPAVKSEFPLRPDLLQVPTNLADPKLREAGLAWLDMILELARQEVVSVIQLSWSRGADGQNPTLQISMDSSRNFRTKKLAVMAGAPTLRYNRRERFDVALTELMRRTTPEALWAALEGTPLAHVSAWDFQTAWGEKTGKSPLSESYPHYTDSREFLFYLVAARRLPPSPWL